MSPPTESHEPEHLNAAVAQCLDAARTLGLAAALRATCAQYPADAEAITRRVRRLAHAGLGEFEPAIVPTCCEELGQKRKAGDPTE